MKCLDSRRPSRKYLEELLALARSDNCPHTLEINCSEPSRGLSIEFIVGSMLKCDSNLICEDSAICEKASLNKIGFLVARNFSDSSIEFYRMTITCKGQGETMIVPKEIEIDIPPHNQWTKDVVKDGFVEIVWAKENRSSETIRFDIDLRVVGDREVVLWSQKGQHITIPR